MDCLWQFIKLRQVVKMIGIAAVSKSEIHSRYVSHTINPERVEPERRLEGQQFTKLGRKY